MILYGSFVELWGVNNTLTFKHYVTAFSVKFGRATACCWTGAAWDSFWTTIKIAAIAAPLTAAVGLITAYLLTRQSFAGKNAFEFGTMLSFAIPGTVIGVSYILAFNVPPIELTGTGIILVISFIFRNMPVGVRAGHRVDVAARQVARRKLADARRQLAGRPSAGSSCRCCARPSWPRWSTASCAP